MKEVIHKHETYAIFGDVLELQKGTTFIGDSWERLQFSVLKYDKGKKLQSHIHKHRERVIKRTQESWIVLKGIVKVFVYNEDKVEIYHQFLNEGQFFISYKGGHGYEIVLDGTIVIENKLGDFVGVEEDKEKF